MVLPETLFNQRIVFSALNWGMGHISRCLPLLTQLQRQGNQITLFCSEKQQKVFQCPVIHDSKAFLERKSKEFCLVFSQLD